MNSGRDPLVIARQVTQLARQGDMGRAHAAAEQALTLKADLRSHSFSVIASNDDGETESTQFVRQTDQ